MRVRRFVPIAAAAALLCLAQPAICLEFKSSPKQVLFVELYTSEAYKGAPAAARWISGLQNTPGLWKDFVPAAFHVDYGDKPGRWKDRFMEKSYTERLITYAVKWGLREPYVPTVVLNGEEWSGWARGNDLPFRETRPGGVLTVRAGKVDEVYVTFTPEDSDTRNWVAHTAVLGFGLTSKVEGGENLGKTFTHDFVVLQKNQKTLQQARDLLRANVKVRLRPDVRASALGIVVWITRSDNPIPIQCVGGYLAAPQKK